MVVEVRRHRELLTKCLNRILLRTLSSAYQSWYAVVLDRKQTESNLENTLKKTVARMHNMLTAGAFATWRSLAQTQKQHRATIAKCVNRITNRHVAASWASWMGVVAEAHRQQDLLKKCFNRILLNTLSAAFQSWRSHTAENKRYGYAMAKIIKRMTNRQITGAYMTWNAVVQKAKHDAALLTKILRTLTNRQVFGAYRAWSSMVAENCRKREMLTRFLQRMENQGLAWAFSQWTAKVRKAAAASAQEYLEDTEERYQEMMGRQVLHRWVNKLLAEALLRWFGVAQERASRRQRLAQCIVHMQQHGIKGTLLVWKEQTQRAGHDRDVARRTVARMSKLREAQAFSKWAAEVQKKKRLRALLGQLSGRTANRCVFRALRAWKAFLHAAKIEAMEGFLEGQHESASAQSQALKEKLHTTEQANAEQLAAQQRELEAAKGLLEQQHMLAVAQQEEMERSTREELGGLEQEVAAREQHERDLEAENRDLEQHLSVLEGLEGKISNLFGELESVAAIVTSPQPAPAPQSPTSPQVVPNPTDVHEGAALALASLLTEDVVAFDLTHGGLLRLGTMDRSHLTSRMLEFIRSHWAVFVSAELDRLPGTNPREQPTAVVLGRALLLAAGMPLELAQAQGGRGSKGLPRLYDALNLRLRWWRSQPIPSGEDEQSLFSPRSPSPSSMQLLRPRSRSRSPPRPAWGPEDNADPETSALNRIFEMMEDKKLRLVDLFHSLDRDGSGSIDAAELVSAFAQHGVHATVDEVSELLDRLDVDGNNHIDIQEFLPQMRAVQNERRREARMRRNSGVDLPNQSPVSAAAGVPAAPSMGKLTLTRQERAERSASQRSASMKKHVARMREIERP